MALNTVLLDTSGYLMFKRGYPQVVEIVRQAPSILLSAIVVGELLAGFDVGSRAQQNRRELAEFQQSLRVRTLPVTAQTADRSARIYAYLRGIGRPIPTNDLWIAATAMEHGAILLTADSHFLDLPQIVVQHLTTGDL
jgi:tRNA(fMet)-specific endonuclease VapC